jgi:hypothetical protein
MVKRALVLKPTRACSDLMMQYDFQEVLRLALSEQEEREQEAAEDVAKKFLHWKPLDETSDAADGAMAKLKAMLGIEI